MSYIIKLFIENVMKTRTSKFQTVCAGRAVRPPVSAILELLTNDIIVGSEH